MWLEAPEGDWRSQPQEADMFVRRLFIVLLVGGLLLSQAVTNVSAATPCNWAQFISDVSIPDGSPVSPGAVFTKIWRLKNIGSCTWTSSYALVFDSGSQMSGASPVNLIKSVSPGQTIDLPVTLMAPAAPGRYRGFWKLSDGAGGIFGIGATASSAFWVDVEVPDSSRVVMDMVAFAPFAQWRSGAGALPFPGTSGDYRGYALRLDSLTMEDGAFTNTPSLLTFPQNRYDGNIQGTYPELTVQKGDRFQSAVGCEYGSSCYVTFRLDYVTPSGATHTFWTRPEMNDGRTNQVSVDLSPLAGQTVRFALSILAMGSPNQDRAIWSAPRIVRTISSTPITPLPPPVLTPTSTPFGIPPGITPSACDKATFIADINVPDGTLFAPGAVFTKTWRLRNSGSCSWTTNYRLVFYTGEQMGAPTSLSLPSQVEPGGTIDLTINMVAPQSAGLHRADWVLSNANGVLFGTGSPAVNPFWLQINVSGGTALGGGYDFAGNVCAAEWRSGAGTLPCPGTDPDANGFVIKQDAPQLEDGSIATLPGLLVAPQFRYGGYIQGMYPAFTVQAGDRFQGMVGCEYKASCYVTFRLDYMSANGAMHTFWSWNEKNEGRFYNADLDLSPLAGQSVRFVLALSAAGFPNGDRVIWGAPRIQRASVPVTPTPPPTTDWLTYRNAKYAFQLRYPKEGQIESQSENYAKILLPFATGTNLREKYMEVQVTENASQCRSPLGIPNPPQTSETVIINGITFLKESAADAGVGHLHQWVAYSTARGTTCASLDFMLHSLNRGAFPTPPPEFNMEAESAVFLQIVSTFTWLGPGEDWLTGHADHIAFKYPRQSQIVDQSDTHVKIELPFTPGTNLHEKYMEVQISENANPCSSTINGPPQSSEIVIINGLSFLKETGSEGATSHLYDWVAYSTTRGGVCASLSFMLHSISPGVYPTPPPVFDKVAESVVFEQIVSTFLWLIPPPVTPETPTFTPTATQPPVTGDWLTYTNARYSFEFRYPKEGQIISQGDTYAKISLPFIAGTNLKEKYLEVQIAENINPCRTSLSGVVQSSETVLLNGISFLKETGMDGAAGNLYDWVAYSTVRDTACISLGFTLHSLNPGAFPTPPVIFDKDAESAVFGQIAATFAWLGAGPTPTPTETPTATATPPGGDWLTYSNARYSFALRYPKEGQLSSPLDNYARITLPISGGTNLLEKYLQVYVAENANPCRTPLAAQLPVQSSETVVINGISYLKEAGTVEVAGHVFQWTSYSTVHDVACLTMNFVLHSGSPASFPTPPPVFNEAAEKAVFEQIVATLAWLGAGPAPAPTETPTETPTVTPSATPIFTPTETPTITPTPVVPTPAGGWLTYTSIKYGFQFMYPQEGQITSQTDEAARIMLPIAAGTTLKEKYLDLRITQTTDVCRSSLGVPQTSTLLFINGMPFRKETGAEGAAGSLYQWTAYSTAHDTTCVSLGFVLHSLNPGAFPTPPPVFNEEQESAIFGQIANTFGWLSQPPSPTPTGSATSVPLPDLAINWMRIELESVGCYLTGTPLGVRIQIANNGQAAASGFQVRVNNAVQQVDGLGIGQTATLFFTGAGNPVDAMADSASAIAESDESNNTRNEMVPIPTAPTPCTPTPTQPVTLIGPYAVTLLNPNDVLNIYSNAGASNLIVGSFSGDATNVMRTGPVMNADGSEWAEVLRPDGGRGWVSSLYLSEYVTGAAFCTDARILPLIGALKLAVNGSNGSQFATLVSPKHGAYIGYWRWGTSVNYTVSTAPGIFADSTVVNWGSGGGSGIDNIGTFSEIVQPDLVDVLNTASQMSCDDPSYASMYPNPWPYTNIRYYAVVKAPTNTFDWKVWLLGFEYVNGQPYLFGTVHYVWEP